MRDLHANNQARCTGAAKSPGWLTLATSNSLQDSAGWWKVKPSTVEVLLVLIPPGIKDIIDMQPPATSAIC